MRQSDETGATSSTQAYWNNAHTYGMMRQCENIISPRKSIQVAIYVAYLPTQMKEKLVYGAHAERLVMIMTSRRHHTDS